MTTLREYYGFLKAKERPAHPARQFILNIALKSGRSEKTVQQWLSGLQEPDEITKMLISEETGIPTDELFPQKNK